MTAASSSGTAQSMSPPRLPCPVARAAFLIDFDGTLAEIVPTPLQARPHPGTAAILSRLAAATGGAVAIVTGRPIASIDELLNLPSLCIAGIHGLERRDASGRLWRAAAASGALAVARERLQPLVEAHPRLLLEDKTLTLALHFRAAPELGGLVDEVTHDIVANADGRLKRMPGSMVIELAPQEASKRIAVDAFLAEPPFQGRVPVYLGDDHGDEEAFRRVNELGGLSVRVGSRGSASAARSHLESVDAAVNWLRELTLRR